MSEVPSFEASQKADCLKGRAAIVAHSPPLLLGLHPDDVRCAVRATVLLVVPLVTRIGDDDVGPRAVRAPRG